MSKHSLKNIGIASFLLFFALGCSPDQQHSSNIEPGLSHSEMMQLDQIRKEYGVVLNIHEHQIIVGTPDLATNEKMSQIKNALCKALGDDFTNYTIVHVVD